MAVDGLRQALGERYTIERELGRGGMATVYLASDVKVGRRVAIKVLLPELAAALGGERFHREIRIATHLSHPNILPVYDSGEADGTLYYVMPYVEGESLRTRLDRERQLPIDDAIRITCQIAASLEYAHGQGIIHRDIKPENILLEAGQAVLADFGIARAVTSAADTEALTRTGMSLGTPAYMSPEQAMGERTLDGRSDQYALACVTYEMLAGQPPFTAPTMQALIARHIAEQVPLITTVRPSVPEEVQDVILQALEKVPADRFASVGDFARALADAGSMSMTATSRRATAARAVRTTRTGRVPQKAAGWSRGKQLLVAAAGVLLLGGSAAAGVWMLNRPRVGAAAGVSGYDAKRIAVLYFSDESRNGELGYLADALTESLIAELGRVRNLDVVSKNGVARFRVGEPSVDSVAAALEAGTVVRGTIRNAGDRVRVEFQLVDGNSGAEYGRGSVEQPLATAARAPRALADKVADVLRERLGSEVQLREERAATSNTAAWSLVQRASKEAKEAEAAFRSDSVARGAEHFAQGDSLLARAEVLDAKWAAPAVARAELALRQVRLTREELRRAELIAVGLGHADRALAIDPDNAEALELRGTLRYAKHLYGLSRDPVEAAALVRTAQEDLQLATKLDPSRASAWNVLSMVLLRQYNKVEAALAAQRAYEEDAYLTAAPDIIWRLYTTSYDLEQFVPANKWCELGAARFPADARFVECKLWLMTTNLRAPNVGEAWRLLGEMEKRTPAAVWAGGKRQYDQMLVAVPIAKAGLRDSAERVIQRSRAGRDVDPRGELIGQELIVRALIGDKEGAIRTLSLFLTAHPEHREGFIRAKAWWWRSLQDDPQFKRLVGAGD